MNMRPFSPIVLLRVLLVTAVLFVAAACDSENPAEQEERIQTPDFVLPDLQGDDFRLSQQRGSVVLLQFFRTTCSVCQSEVADLAALHERFGEEGLDVVAVAIDSEDPEAVRAFADEYEISYTVLLDDGRVSRSYQNAFGRVQRVPYTFIIDREGWVNIGLEGGQSQQELRERIEALL